MIEDKVGCNTCNSLILESTKTQCGGYCMRCYMKEHYGFRPDDIKSIKKRKLTLIFAQWNKIQRNGVPNIRNPLIRQKLNHCIPVISQSVTKYFRSNDVKFEGREILALLYELKLLPDDELKKYVAEIEKFIVDLSHSKH